jgi:hypothetical protein
MWIVTRCSLVDNYSVSEECNASIFRVTSSLNIEAILSSETFVTSYRSTRLTNKTIVCSENTINFRYIWPIFINIMPLSVLTVTVRGCA